MNSTQATEMRDNYERLIFSRTSAGGSARLFRRCCPYTGKLSDPVSKETADFWVRNLDRVIVKAPGI